MKFLYILLVYPLSVHSCNLTDCMRAVYGVVISCFYNIDSNATYDQNEPEIDHAETGLEAVPIRFTDIDENQIELDEIDNIKKAKCSICWETPATINLHYNNVSKVRSYSVNL